MTVHETLRIFGWLFHLINISFTNALPVSPSIASYDVIIVGGGPAGLAAAMSLGRVGRSVLLFDSAEYRNAATQEMHDVIALDGTPPAEFRALARDQIHRYPSVMLLNETVESVSKIAGDNDSSGDFIATTTNGGQYSSRKVVLATGMRDILPSTPGLKEAWGKGIFWCLWCDGWEHKDKPFGNLGKFSASSVKGAVAIAQTINPETVILSNGTFTPEAKAKASKDLPDWLQWLHFYNITVEDRTIKSFGRVKGNASDYADDILVTFDDGKTLTRNGIKGSFPAELASDLPMKMGLNLTQTDEHEIKVLVDKNMQTTLDGVFTVGDANSDGSSNVPHALWSAKRAVIAIHSSLGVEYATEYLKDGSLNRRELPSDITFDAMNDRLRTRSIDARSVAQEWMEWLDS